MAEMWERAVREKLRFDTGAVGQASLEDLWDLPLQTSSPNKPCLDRIAQILDKKLSDGSVKSFVTNTTKAHELTQFMLDVVKRVIQVRMEENAAKVTENEKAATKQKILSILARKKDAALENASEEELLAMVNSM